MASDDQATRWQSRLDREFPRGLLATWEDDDTPYLVPWVQVQGMRGADPIVYFTNDSGRWFGPVALTSYEQFQASPHRMVRVTMDGEDRAMVWCAAVPPRAQVQLRRLRAAAMGVSPPV